MSNNPKTYVTDPAIMRLAQTAGITRLSALCYEEIRAHLDAHLNKVTLKSVIMMSAGERKTITAADVQGALKIMDRTTYDRYCGQKTTTLESGGTRVTADCPTSNPKTVKGLVRAKRVHPYRKGTLAKRTVKHMQKQTDVFFIPQMSFQRVARKVGDRHRSDTRYSKEALHMMQSDAELYLVNLLKGAKLSATGAKRTTVMPKDIQLAHYLKTH